MSCFAFFDKKLNPNLYEHLLYCKCVLTGKYAPKLHERHLPANTGGPCMKADGGVAMLTSLFVGTRRTTIKAPVRFIPKSPQTSGTKHITASQHRWENRKTLFAAREMCRAEILTNTFIVNASR